MDAILAYDDQGRPVEPAWPEADVIVGNPPFLGDKKMRSELGDEYVEQLRSLYAGRVPGGADLVTYWFERARALIEQGKMKRAGLLATQSIRGGANRKVLEQIKASGDIFMAWADRAWVLDGASVRVSMVGFDRGEETARELDGTAVASINANLTGAIDLTKARSLKENSSLGFIGTQKTGPFELTPDQAISMLTDKGNPNGCPNSDVVKPWINGADITDRPKGLWIVFFGENMILEEASLYEKPFEYIRKIVRPVRLRFSARTASG